MFNWLTVIVLFTIEIVCSKFSQFAIYFYIEDINHLIIIITEPIFGVGYLEWLSGEIVKGVNSSSGEGEVKILKVVTDPFVDLIIQVSMC
jgi:sodium-dependent phosphate cotransporter